MAEGNQLMVPDTRAVGPSYEQVKEMAHYFARSGLFGVSTPEQAFSLLMIAQSEGLHPARAMQEYHVIKNKPSLKAEAMLGRFQQSGGKVRWVKHEDDEVIAEFTHAASGTTEVSWNMARAKTAGVTGNDTWKKYPRQMLRARVISEGVRLSYPGCIVGFYAPEEVMDFTPAPEPIRQKVEPPAEVVTTDGEVIEAETVETEGQKVPRVDVSPLDANGKTNRELKEAQERLARMIDNCGTEDDLDGWLDVTESERADLPEDVTDDLRGRWKRRRDAIRAKVSV
jgi:hypothetical protein